MATNENLPPNVIKQLAKELKNLNETPPEGIKVVVDDNNFSIIFADIEGPVGTPYENGVFHMKLILSHDFPHSPPKGYFLTRIFHPNIANNGEICVNALKKDWNPTLGLRHVLMVIRCLLIEPFPESALNEQAGKLLLENYEEYARHARIITGIHALKSKTKSKTGAISESKSALNVEQPPSTLANNAAADQGSTAVQPTSQLASGAAGKGGVLSHDLVDTASAEVGASTTTSMQKKEPVVVAKAAVDKKKIDARKKSLKRL